MTDPRGIRLNNPGNIRLNPRVTWQGQSVTQTDADFVQFDAPVYGIRAIGKILITYSRDGVQTIGDAIDRWAPPNENDTDSYKADVATRVGIGADVVTDITAAGTMTALCRAITHHENGNPPAPEADWYTDDLYAQGVGMALGAVS